MAGAGWHIPTSLPQLEGERKGDGSRSTMFARTFRGSPMPESFQVVPSKCMLTLPAS